MEEEDWSMRSGTFDFGVKKNKKRGNVEPILEKIGTKVAPSGYLCAQF
jgi:hypothetical protein